MFLLVPMALVNTIVLCCVALKGDGLTLLFGLQFHCIIWCEVMSGLASLCRYKPEPPPLPCPKT
jgi:hypothetical protein